MNVDVAVASVGISRDVKAQWAWHLGALGALIALILLLFQYEVVHAVEVWWIYPTYSHCFLIIPISAWLIWGMRDELMAEVPSLAPKALLAVPPILLIWLAAKFATVNEVRQFAVVALMQVAILAMLGTRIYRKILFPALFLFFLVPVGQYLIAPMQRFATIFTDTGLTLLGVPHYTEGTLIELANGKFEIAEACAGLRFLIATMTLGVLFAHLTYRKWWKIGVFLASCVVVPLIGNGLRCIGIIMVAHLTDNKVAVGVDHLVYGWGFNMAILAVLFFIGLRFKDPIPDAKPIVASRTHKTPHRAVLSLAAVAAVIMSVGPAFAYWHDTRSMMVNQEALQRPFVLEGWTIVAPTSNWNPLFNEADGQLITGLSSKSASTGQVDLAIKYYGRMRERHSLIAGTNRLWDRETWHLLQSRMVTANIDGKPVRFKESLISTAVERRLVWSTYWMDGTFTTSAPTIKLLQIKTAFTGNEGSALVALSTQVEGAPEPAREQLKSALQALSELPKRLSDMGRASQPPRSARTSN